MGVTNQVTRIRSTKLPDLVKVLYVWLAEHVQLNCIRSVVLDLFGSYST